MFMLQYNFKHSVMDKGRGADTRRHGGHQYRRTEAEDAVSDGY